MFSAEEAPSRQKKTPKEFLALVFHKAKERKPHGHFGPLLGGGGVGQTFWPCESHCKATNQNQMPLCTQAFSCIYMIRDIWPVWNN